MFEALGNIAGTALGGPVGGLIGGAIGGALGGGGDAGQATAFEDALGQFAMQVAGDSMDEMSQAMSETEEDFA